MRLSVVHAVRLRGGTTVKQLVHSYVHVVHRYLPNIYLFSSAILLIEDEHELEQGRKGTKESGWGLGPAA
jgi:hypothetical protein